MKSCNDIGSPAVEWSTSVDASSISAFDLEYAGRKHDYLSWAIHDGVSFGRVKCIPTQSAGVPRNRVFA